MGKNSTHGNKILQTLNLTKEGKQELEQQAKKAGIPMSAYIERLLLEKKIQNERKN